MASQMVSMSLKKIQLEMLHGVELEGMIIREEEKSEFAEELSERLEVICYMDTPLKSKRKLS